MQQKKKTALRTRAHRRVSSASQESGLIVTANTAKRSAGTARAIDNRSHRTPKFSCSRINKNERSEQSLPRLTAATHVT